jgi:glycosyl transferase family 2
MTFSDVLFWTGNAAYEPLPKFSQAHDLAAFTLHAALTALVGALACAWVILAMQTALGVRRVPHLSSVTPLPAERLPSVSLLVSARDEAEKMPAALRSMLALDYPNYEVIVVDDRSGDATPEILREFAATCKHLQAIRVEALPAGWLGKPHGLQTAYEHSRGEWLVFTDADVRYEPSALRLAVSLALERGYVHLTLFPRIEMMGFWEKTLLTYFALGGFLYTRPWTIPNPNSRAYAGAGVFQLLRRSAYESMGTHRRLAMEVVDDMKLGKLVKETGHLSGVALPDDLLGLRWHSGVGNIIRGTEKNFFAVTGFRLGVTLAQIGVILLLSVVPFLAILLATGWARAFAIVAAACAVLLEARIAAIGGASPLYGLTHPAGALLVCYMAARSAFLTLWQRGIYWRGTFYPLSELRRGGV